MWPDHRGNRAGEECMTTQMPPRCGRPLISILVLGTGSLLSLCPRHKSGELLGGGGSLLALDWRVPRSWWLIRRFTVYMGRSLLSSVMLDWIVGHCRDVGTMYAPGRQSPAKPGGASSSRNEVAWRMRTKLTLACCFEGVVPVIKSLGVRLAPKTRSGL